MKKNRLGILGIISALLIAGCGSSSKNEAASADRAYEDTYAVAAAEAPMYEEDYEAYDYDDAAMVTEEASAYSAGTEGGSEASVDEKDVEDSANQKSGRMLIKTVFMNVESEDVDAMTKNVEKRVDELGG